MGDQDHVLKLRYVGARFAGARLPVDVLFDLPAFRDLVVAFAKSQWLRDNPERQRLPKGFERGIHFDLVAVEDGSAVPCLRWEVEETQGSIPGFSMSVHDRVSQSVDAVATLWENADRGQYPASLSPAEIGALDKLGSGLLDGERIEFKDRTSNTGNIIYLDAAKRRDIITRVKSTYERSIEGMGRLVANQENGYIKIHTSLFGEISIHVGEADVKNTYDGHISQSILFDLVIELDNLDRFRSVVRVRRLELVDEEFQAELAICRNRVDELRLLKAGWNNGSGLAVTSHSIFGAQKLLELKPEYAKAFRIYPTETGGILFEFEAGIWDMSIEIADTGSAELYGVEIDGPNEIVPQKFSSVGNDLLQMLNEKLDKDA